MRFKLNTARRSTSRVRGWTSTSDLEQTIKSCSQENKPALIEAIKKELAKAREVDAKNSADYDRINKKSFEQRWSVAVRNNALRKVRGRCDRSFWKVDALEKALKELEV